MIISIIYAFLGLSFLIIIHEFGHFSVARYFGTKIVRFSIGFGPALIRWRNRYGTEFTVCPILLGGYVRFLEIAEARNPADKGLFQNKPIPVRLAVVIAGPLANLVLAYVFWVAIGLYGIEGLKPVIGKVDSPSPAASARLAAGDEIIQVNERDVRIWQEVNSELVSHFGKSSVPFLVQDEQNRQRPVMMDLREVSIADLERRSLAEIVGIIPRLPPTPPVIGNVIRDSAAAQAGIKEGDRILRINDLPINLWSEWSDAIYASPAKAMSLKVERERRELDIRFIPQSLHDKNGQEYGFAGVSPVEIEIDPEYLNVYSYSLLNVWYPAFFNTRQNLDLIFTSLKYLFNGELSVKNLSGPVNIVRYVGVSARSGIENFLRIMAFISLSLGVFNLFPLPVLDGGHIVLYLIEAVRKKPVSPKFQEYYFKVGFIFLLLLLIFVTYNDLTSLL